MERFNRTYRKGVLDFCLFSNVAEARAITEQWLEGYNAMRPHEALDGFAPSQYVCGSCCSLARQPAFDWY